MTFEVVNLIQGSPEWKAHRAAHFNASDAPAMMGCSRNTGRGELVKQLASGIERDFSDYVQERVLDKGHTFEAYARPLAEGIIGEDLYPIVGKNGRNGASYDGLTMMEDIGFEHKSLNAVLREAMHDGCTGESLPLDYQVQMEHQCMVCPTIEKVLFMASEWDRHGNLIEERHCWYYPNPKLRAEIVTGWELIEKDVAAYDPSAEAAPEVVGQAPDQLPALRIDVTGMVTASNLEGFKAVALRTIGAIKTTLVTDQDFADAEKTVKWCEQVESSLDAAKQHALGQTESIDRLFRTIDEISEQARAVRLKLQKLVESEKKSRKEQIVMQAQASLDEHIAGLNRELGAMYLPRVAGVLAPVIKGLKSLDSMQEKVQGELARQITSANTLRDCLKANRDHLEHEDGSWMSLFPDFATVGTKAAEDFQALAALRIERHKAAEAARLDAERNRIRAEEAEKLQREAEAREREEASAQQRANQAASEAAAAQAKVATAVIDNNGQDSLANEFPGNAGTPVYHGHHCEQKQATAIDAKEPPATNNAAEKLPIDERVKAGLTITLGAINERLGIFDVKASTLAAVGISAEKHRGAVHMDISDFDAFCVGLRDHIEAVRAQAAQ